MKTPSCLRALLLPVLLSLAACAHEPPAAPVMAEFEFITAEGATSAWTSSARPETQTRVVHIPSGALTVVTRPGNPTSLVGLSLQQLHFETAKAPEPRQSLGIPVHVEKIMHCQLAKSEKCDVRFGNKVLGTIRWKP